MNEDVISLVVPGAPRGKGRPRFDGRSRRAYTDPATEAHENAVCVAWFQAGRPKLEGALTIYVELVVERPATHWTDDGVLSPAGEATQWPFAQKPDVDNALKLCMDALNAKAYGDDVQIVSATAIRRWANAGEDEHTVIKIDTAPVLALRSVA